MIAGLQQRVNELRFVDGVEKVEHVPYPTEDEFWVRFSRYLDLRAMQDITRKHGLVMLKFGGLPSKLPRKLSELLWDGVNYVITKNIGGWSKFTASLGFEPESIAKIATDAHGPYEIYIATQEEGIQILYEYLGLKYAAPAPPPTPVATPKPPTQAAVKPTTPSQRPVAPTTPAPATPAPTAKPTPAPRPAQPVTLTPQSIPKGQYRPRAWGQKLTGGAGQQSASTEEKS